MIIAVFLICLSVKTVFSVELKCQNFVSCRCGRSRENVTVCAQDNEVCPRFSNCETCNDSLIACSKCPSGLEGPLCSQEIKKSRQKRQNRRPYRPSNSALTSSASSGERYCQDPGIDPNGSRVPRTPPSERGFPPGSQLEYSCYENYALNGKSILFCMSSGRWSASVPRCRANAGASERKCPDPGHVDNAERLNSDGTPSMGTQQYKVGQSVVYTCYSGFTLQGRSLITCQSSGSWSSRKPYCGRADVVPETDMDRRQQSIQAPPPSSGARYCQDPGVDPNGIRVPSSPPTGRGFSPGTQLEYTCNRNYDLSGRSNLFCLSSGRWSGNPPTCRQKTGVPRDIYCSDLGPVSNGHGHLLLPMDTRISDTKASEYPAGTRIQFSCDSGYTLQGEPTLTCEQNGYWSNEKPSCIRTEASPELYCSDLGLLVNGHGHVFLPLDTGFTKPSANKYPVGTRNQYSCDSGYILEGEPDLICEKDGYWSHEKPSCKPDTVLYCPPLGGIQNGAVLHIPSNKHKKTMTSSHSHQNNEEKFSDGCKLQYSCDNGYSLKGSATLTCDAAGRWSSVPPKCIINDISTIFCKDLGPIFNGHGHVFKPTDNRFSQPTGNRYPVGTRLQYSCEIGYVLEGESDLICERDGFWSDVKPSCRTDTDKYCPPLGEIENGNAVHIPPINKRTRPTDHSHIGSEEQYAAESQMQYSCYDGYTLEGPDTLTCRDTGRWSASPPKCTKYAGGHGYCPSLGDIRNGMVVHNPSDKKKRKSPFQKPGERESQYTTGSKLQYFCNEGYSLEGPITLTCEETGRWSADPPKCMQMSVGEMNYCDSPEPIMNGKLQYFPNANTRWSNKPENLDYDTNEVPEGALIKYFCDEGYRLKGELSRICLRNGSWSGKLPACIADCGKSFAAASNRVFMGEWANSGEWPWVVSIHAVYGDQSSFICGGAVVDHQTVITAAHCLVSGATGYILRFGKHHFKLQDDDPDVLVRKSRRVIVHPGYNQTAFTLDNDIGLVMFEPKIRYSTRVQPICLPSSQTSFLNVMTGRVGYVCGWGDTEYNTAPDVMMMTSLPVVNPDTCVEVFRKQNVVINRNMFCAGYEDLRQTVCNGDSGSPLVFYDSSSERYTIEGLVSFGNRGQCGFSGQYVIFTRIVEYMLWIYTHIQRIN